jgi:hypothetical protein
MVLSAASVLSVCGFCAGSAVGPGAPKFDSKTDKRVISFRPNGQKCYNNSAVRLALAG